MIYGLQTHFNAPVDAETLNRICAEGVGICRVDAQVCSHETMRQMVDDVRAAGMVPLVIVADLERLDALPGDVDVEWTNEPDGDVDPSEYRRGLDEACQMATSRGQRLWAPAISNLSEAAFRWANAVRDAGGGWPDGLYGVSVHRYGPGGAVETPHEGFISRDNEVGRWLLALCQGKPFLVSEFGWDTEVLSEEQAAERIAWEWAFWERHGAFAAVLYQLNDGPNAGEHYGVRRIDGTWKEAILTTIPKPVPTPAPEPPIPPDQPVYPFPAEAGRLHIDGMTFRTEGGALWQWRGYSWFLGFLRYCRGEDVTPDLRWLRTMGFNLVRVFGPLPWKETPDYRPETFYPRLGQLHEFFALVASAGLRCEFVPICMPFDRGLEQTITQGIFDVAAAHDNVVIEVANEPHVNKTDPFAVLAGIDRRGVLTSSGVYGSYYATPASYPPVIDYGTVHIQRDAAWHRKARHAQELQQEAKRPWISDEPAKITEPNFDYPGGKNDPAKTPAEIVWHAAVCGLYTPGFTFHCEEGKWGRVPKIGMLQHTCAEAVRDAVFLRIGPEWQTGTYKGGHSSGSPVDGKGLKINGQDIWTYSSVHPNQALAVRCAFSAPQPQNGWTVVDRWGPNGSLVRLER